jgi:hypothetical protein
MVLDLFLTDGRKRRGPRKTRRNSLTGISVLKVYLTESLPLLPNRVNRWLARFVLIPGLAALRLFPSFWTFNLELSTFDPSGAHACDFVDLSRAGKVTFPPMMRIHR